jgi:hypothetical protein
MFAAGDMRLLGPGPASDIRLSCGSSFFLANCRSAFTWSPKHIFAQVRFMSSILIAAAPAHFLAGLVLVTLAGMAGVALYRITPRRPLIWGLSALVALGFGEWCSVTAGGPPPIACQWIRLMFVTCALVGLVELGRLCLTARRTGLLPRWSYPVVAVVAIAAAWLALPNLLLFALSAAICWQAGWLAADFLRHDETSAANETGTTFFAVVRPSQLGPRIVVGGLLAYLATASFAIPLVSLLAAVVAVAAAYLVFGPNAEKGRQTQLLWRCVWPVGFVVVAAGGCYLLPTVGVTEHEVLLVEIVGPAGGRNEGDHPSDEAPSADENDFSSDSLPTGGASAAAGDTPVFRQAKRIGLGLSPIIIFVMLIWGLSRLPFVH